VAISSLTYSRMHQPTSKFNWWLNWFTVSFPVHAIIFNFNFNLGILDDWTVGWAVMLVGAIGSKKLRSQFRNIERSFVFSPGRFVKAGCLVLRACAQDSAHHGDTDTPVVDLQPRHEWSVRGHRWPRLYWDQHGVVRSNQDPVESSIESLRFVDFFYF